MLKIAPEIGHSLLCPRCGKSVAGAKLLWQGLHVCLQGECCGALWVEDLPAGHALYNPCKINLTEREIVTPAIPAARQWLASPLLQSILNPCLHNVEVRREKFVACKKVIILNCLDPYYGHGLLKLFNAQEHLTRDREYGVIVLLPEFLRWLVPEGVAEIWTVKLGLKDCGRYYPDLERQIKEHLPEYDEAYLSPVRSHPDNFDIEKFTRTQPHEMSAGNYRISFIWREDRPWTDNRFLLKFCRPRQDDSLKARLVQIPLALQRRKVISLFSQLRKTLPRATFTVCGLGTTGAFPAWIEDARVAAFTESEEKTHAALYAQSRLVIGVLGSNMLLPSGLAGMTVDLVPRDRWSNLTHDMLYGNRRRNLDPRMQAYLYRYLPLDVKITQLAEICTQMLNGYPHAAELLAANPFSSYEP